MRSTSPSSPSLDNQNYCTRTSFRAEPYLSQYPNVHIHKGFFPAATGDVVRDKKFSFVNLDVDTYASTRDSLEFFYPRLLPGGILMSHDYAQAEGVRKAFDEVLGSKPESIIELPESQCMFIKQG
jgi:hypothetical protein